MIRVAPLFDSQCSSSSTVVVVQSSNKMGHVNEGSHCCSCLSTNGRLY